MHRRSLLAAPALLAALPARAQGVIKMTIATGVDPAFSPFYVGKEGGFFEHIRTITAYLVFPDWSTLMQTLIDAKPPPHVEAQLAR